MNFNKHFRIVLQPKDPNLHGKRRFAVGAYSLFKYVGQENANKALQRAISSKTDKYTVRLRSFGSIEFYSK